MNKLTLILIALIIFLWAGSPFVLNFFLNDTVKQGAFGDSFGAINSLFSGLAFAGIIYTIALQRKELELQREELKLTREELQKSAEAQTEASKTLSITAQLNSLTAKLNHYGKTLIGLKQDHSHKDYGKIKSLEEEIKAILNKISKLEEELEF